ncbi:MAG: substrate-binding domain-containing protein [Actinobacteria bacterium]|nr:substrate-binding domain-containing protein [Actinomycetota bacterium]
MVVSVREVAKRANVSTATVSLAMRNHRRISEPTRRKVQMVARELGYAPNASAKMLSTGRSDVVGVTIFDMLHLSAPYIGSIMSGIADMSDDEGLNLAFARTACKRYEEAEYIRFAREGRFAGEIIIDQTTSERELQILASIKMPTVLVDRKIPSLDFPVVRINYHEVVKKAISHLVGLGHKRIAVISGSEQLFDLSEKLVAYRQALKEHNIVFDPHLVKICKGNNKGEIDLVKSVRENVDAVLDLPEPPTAFFCFIDTAPMIMCDAIRFRGVRIPEDVSVLCFNTSDSPQSGFLIGGVKVPGYEMGKRACQLMLDLLQGHVATRDVVLEAKFDPGYSCVYPRKSKRL